MLLIFLKVRFFHADSRAFFLFFPPCSTYFWVKIVIFSFFRVCFYMFWVGICYFLCLVVFSSFFCFLLLFNSFCFCVVGLMERSREERVGRLVFILGHIG